MKLRTVLALFCVFLATSAGATTPNIVIIFIDDMGYADIGPFGAKGYSTPNLDKMAQAGTKFTNFHVAQPVCSASRTGLLTGCYPNRIGIHGALGPGSKTGISDNEMTLAQLVKQKGYATASVGKWHLGDHAQFLPTRHGFDEYLGIPYSNDMWPFHPAQVAGAKKGRKGGYPPLPMYDGEKVIDSEVTPEDQCQLTTQYTERAVSFIERSKDKPFFLYLAHNMCHVPLFVSDKFKGKSERGLFGDVIMELDWSVGQVMDSLKRTGTFDNTLVVFTSDNGPWLVYGDHAGSAGPLREGKGSCWEGGVRVPCLMQWPGHIQAGAVSDKMFMTIDLFPTIAGLVGAKLPDHKIDGLDVLPIIENKPEAKNPHEFYSFYYENNQLQAITSGDGAWKLQLAHTFRSIEAGKAGSGGQPGLYGQVKVKESELYQVTGDIGERKDVAASNPEMKAKLEAAAEAMRKELGDSLTKRTGKGVREPGRFEPAKLP